MSVDFYMLIGVALLSVFGLAFLYIKDMENQRKLKSYEKNLEELNRQLFNLQKTLKEPKAPIKEEIDVNEVINNKTNEMRGELQNDIKNALSNIAPLVDILEGLQKSFQIHKNKIELRMEQLEERMKGMVTVSNILSTKDEEKIITLFKNGKTPDEIAKEIRISKGEVDFVLKLSNLGESQDKDMRELIKESQKELDESTH